MFTDMLLPLALRSPMNWYCVYSCGDTCCGDSQNGTDGRMNVSVEIWFTASTAFNFSWAEIEIKTYFSYYLWVFHFTFFYHFRFHFNQHCDSSCLRTWGPYEIKQKLKISFYEYMNANIKMNTTPLKRPTKILLEM